MNSQLIVDKMTLLSSKELAIIGGADYIANACAVFGIIAVATGGSAIANPVGATAGLFCVGYAFGVAVGGWLA
jgi:hypothetical protein